MVSWIDFVFVDRVSDRAGLHDLEFEHSISVGDSGYVQNLDGCGMVGGSIELQGQQERLVA